ncbi:MAG: DUF2029 domain-containing protein [Anaerolineae bacterium]|nr:DUF2029 domain-containing protein [Anaerolineae bacterium]
MAILLAGIVLVVIRIPFPVSWDFQNNLWAPAHLLLQGQSPYHIQEMIPKSNAVWMPAVISVFLPLGLLPVHYASNLWLVINLLILFAIVGISIQQLKHRRLAWFVVCVFGLVLFPPVLTHFLLGQISFLICLLFLAAIGYWQQLPAAALGLIFSISVAKPQLAIFLFPTWLFILLRQKAYRKVVLTCVWAVAWTGLFLIPFFLLAPGWSADFLANLTANKDWAHPSLISYLVHALPVNRYFIIIPWVALGLAGSLYLAVRLPARTALLWSLAFTPLFSPYIWSWDFILFIPLVLETVFDETQARKRWLVAGGFLVVESVYLVMKFNGLLSDHLYWWVPWVVAGLLAVVHVLPANQSLSANPPSAPSQS